MKNVHLRLLVLIVAIAPLLGCASFSTFGLARTMNKGAVQGWVAPGAGGAIATTTSTTTNTTSSGKTTSSTSKSTEGLGYPMLEGGVRYGATDNIELGARLGFTGINLDGKFALVRSPTMQSGLNLSLDPGVGFIGFGGSSSSGSSEFIGVVNMSLPLLVGVDFGGHELVVGPRVVNQVLFGQASSSGSSGGGTVDLVYLGGSLGFAIRASQSVRILPEGYFGVPVYGATSTGSTGSGFGGMLFGGGLAFLFGSSSQYETPGG